MKYATASFPSAIPPPPCQEYPNSHSSTRPERPPSPPPPPPPSQLHPSQHHGRSLYNNKLFSPPREGIGKSTELDSSVRVFGANLYNTDISLYAPCHESHLSVLSDHESKRNSPLGSASSSSYSRGFPFCDCEDLGCPPPSTQISPSRNGTSSGGGGWDL